jgi:hypothetical protein
MSIESESDLAGPRAEVVSQVASGLPLISNATVELRPIPTDDGRPSGSGLFLQYELKVPGTNGPDITEALWQANLFAGAVASQFAARGLGRVAGAEGTLVMPDGRHEKVGGGIGRAVPDQLFDSIPADLADVVARNAAASGMRHTRVSTVRGLQDAVVIQATTDTPKATASRFATGDTLGALIGGSPTRFEGVFLKILDANGSPVYMVGTAPRAAASMAWVRPDFGIAIGPGFGRTKGVVIGA